MILKIKKINSLIILFFLLFLIELISINFAIYNYDGFHLGLIINSANDLINGKHILLQRGKKNYFLVKAI